MTPVLRRIFNEIILPSLLYLHSRRKWQLPARSFHADYRKLSNIMLLTFDRIADSIVHQINWVENNFCNSSEIKEIEVLNADIHNGGRLPLRILLGSDIQRQKSIALKSVDPSSHELLLSVSSIVCESLALKNITGEIYCRGSNIFARKYNIQSSKIPEESLDHYFFSYGVLASIANILQISDLHFENVITEENRPVIIDSEIIFSNSGKFSKKWSYRSSDLLFTDTSPVSQKKYRAFIENYFDDGIMRYRKTKNTTENIIRNQNDSLVNIYEYVQAVEDGLNAADRIIRVNINTISDLMLQWASAPHTCRCLILPTAYYKVLQMKIWNPGFEESLDKRISMIKNCLYSIHRRLHHTNHISSLVDSEIRSLTSNDIPYFSIDGINGNLLSDEKVIERKFSLTSKAMSEIILNRLNNKKSRKSIKDKIFSK